MSHTFAMNLNDAFGQSFYRLQVEVHCSKDELIVQSYLPYLEGANCSH